MSLHESQDHERLLAELLVESDDPRAALRASPLSSCEACKTIAAGHADAARRLRALAAEEQSALSGAEARELPEGRAEAALRAHVLGADRPARSADRPARSARPRRLMLLTAAASVIAFLVWRANRSEPPALADPLLGGEGELVHPLGVVEAFAPFRWRAERPANGWFRVVVRDWSDGGESRTLAESPRLEEQEWSPTQAELAAWPRRIRWTLEVHRGTGASDVARSLSASAELSP